MKFLFIINHYLIDLNEGFLIDCQRSKTVND